eukprot:467886-Rhodomonas_salina.3
MYDLLLRVCAKAKSKQTRGRPEALAIASNSKRSLRVGQTSSMRFMPIECLASAEKRWSSRCVQPRVSYTLRAER